MIEDRTYQLTAVGSAREAISTTGRALIVMASGLGKMLTSALVWSGFRSGRGLFLVHTNEILDHATKEYRKVFGEETSLALYNGFNKKIEGIDIVFATFQTMRENLDKFPPDYFAWMTVDETHHSQADSYRRVIEYFDCPRLGITATPDRDDLKDIRELFGQEVYELGLAEAIARGLLPEIEYHLMTDEVLNQKELELIAHEVIEDGRRVHLGQLNRRLFVEARDEQVAEIIKSHSHKAIIFCAGINHTIHFKSFFKRGATYHSGNFRRKNRSALEGFREGTIRHLLVVDSLNEGADFPEVELLVFYRSTESERIFLQQLGRGLRPGKGKLVVLDFVGNFERLLMLKKLRDEVIEHQSRLGVIGEGRNEGVWIPGETFRLNSPNIHFHFTDTLISLAEILRRTHVNFYANWQEASEATKQLNIRTAIEYKKKYLRDPRLPSNPNAFYEDFPGWPEFLGKKRVLYKTWEEASVAAQKLGIKSQNEYYQRFREDPRLHSGPHRIYTDFPGYREFLGVSFYSTWEEASVAAQKLVISTKRDYEVRYKDDPRLVVNLRSHYTDFPGWARFLGKTT
ncbi:MAG: Type restriction protein res subunit [Parcubacteria group bacterium]|nr:Type restriction protein res subunit [Parcubacteria group bacterium]